MLINSYLGRLYNETAKEFESGNYKAAAMISLEIAFLKGRVGTANFVFLAQKYLSEITVGNYYKVLEDVLSNDHVIKDLKLKEIIDFNDTASFMSFSYPRWNLIDPGNRILNLKDIITSENVFERIVTILESDLIREFNMGLVSFHKLQRLYNKGFENEESIKIFESEYQRTLKMLEKSKAELITENSDLYKAEAYFLKAKLIHFYESQILELSKIRAIEFYELALSFKSPRNVIYMPFYLYLKTELLFDNLSLYLRDLTNQSYIAFTMLILLVFRAFKAHLAKYLIMRESQHA